MNNQIAFEELMKVIAHIREDEMRLERIARCLKLDIEHETLMEEIENNQSPQLKTFEMPSRLDAKREESILQMPGSLYKDKVEDTHSTKQELNKEISKDYPKGCGNLIFNAYDDGDRYYDANCGDGYYCQECSEKYALSVKEVSK